MAERRSSPHGEPRTSEPLLVLTGPTGAGKSALALALAERLAVWRRVEIISVDSAQVYRGMDIGTAKPSAALRAQLPHHLIDIRDPSEGYSAGEFVRDARAAIAAIHARGGLPMLVGGTLLYLRALHTGLALLPPASPALRRELDAEAAARGWPALHAELARHDPDAAARIQPQDAQRIQRALEVWRLTGTALSRWQRSTHGAATEFQWLRYALVPDSRTALRAQLVARFAAMLEAGLVDEVRRLHARGDLHPALSALRAVGYRQLWAYLDGKATLEEATQRAVTASAQLAKRQLTWLKRELGYVTLSVPSMIAAVGVQEALAKGILEAAGA